MDSILDLGQDSASGRVLVKFNLPNLQSKMKCDPEGYGSELTLIHNQFKSLIQLFERQASLNFTSLSGIANDPTVAKNLGDRSMFLANVAQLYPKQLPGYPNELVQFLKSSARSLPSELRVNVTRAVILLINRKMIDTSETLVLFVELQTLGDKTLKTLVFSHLIQSIRGMNQKHRNDPKNWKLQNILYGMLRQEEEAKAKVALAILCDLHRRKVWLDDRTANAICMACFHVSSRIMRAALSFLLGFEKILDDDDSDDTGSDDDTTKQPQIVLNKELVYKASNKGTTSSKKKKRAKLLRVTRSMKKKQRLSSECNNTSYSPLNHLTDAQGFVEKLLSRLQNCTETFEIKMMALKVIARTVGLHRLLLLNFYPYLQKYVQPYQRDINSLLCAAVQACHDMVPLDAVEPLFKQIVNQFVHDRSRPEDIILGLNTVREICLRMPLLMTEDLLQDLVLYRNAREKEVPSAARSLLNLFRVVCPSMLSKKDRGRPANPKARPKAYGEVTIASDIPDIELLDQCGDMFNDVNDEENKDAEREFKASTRLRELYTCSNDGGVYNSESRPPKRKFSDFEELNAANKSLRALKKLAGVKSENAPSDGNDGILSNEDFQRIKELKAKKEAQMALTQHGLKLPSSEQLRVKRFDAAKLEANIKQKLTKEERLALVRAGREERGKYQARTAMKRKKTGGLSNEQKEHKKAMPLAAKRAKVTNSRQEKKKRQRSGKQFRGRKAWK